MVLGWMSSGLLGVGGESVGVRWRHAWDDGDYFPLKY
jgi:hypothetical protein